MGVRNAMPNLSAEVSRFRPRFATVMGIGGLRAELLVRF